MKDEFLKYCSGALEQNIFVKLTLGKYRGGEKELLNIYAEPVKIGNEVLLGFRYKYKTKDTFKNYTFESALAEIENYAGRDFLHCVLFTTQNDIVLEFNKKREARIYKKKPTFSRVELKPHNREKPRFIDCKTKFLHLLGITNKAGEIHSNSYDKFRQIDKFIEIVDALYRSSGLTGKDKLTITDFGSGKSYLTFAMYHYFNNILKKDTTVTGIEQREELTDLSNKSAKECRYAGLKFYNSTILNYKIGKSDIVTALHACDTATDDAIRTAVKSNAEIIILAPCCQKYVRKQITIPDNLKSILSHGIIEEHISSFVTDGLRSLMLEAYGYKTKIFEFISPEHTSKNIMITAVKEKSGGAINVDKMKEIENIKSQFGISDFYLDKILI